MVKKNKYIALSLCACSLFFGYVVNASEIECNTAKMQAMDKITGRVNIIEVPVGGEIKFGTFSIVVRNCQTRSPEETPENFAFVDVVDYPLNEEPINIFKGWMLSSNPAINPVEHPIYDVWLLECVNRKTEGKHLLSEKELQARDEMNVYKAEEPQITEIETEIKVEEPLPEEISEPQNISDIVNRVMIEDVTFAVSEDVGDEEPNIIIPEYQFKIGE